jgi:hypothetical protein
LPELRKIFSLLRATRSIGNNCFKMLFNCEIILLSHSIARRCYAKKMVGDISSLFRVVSQNNLIKKYKLAMREEREGLSEK